MSGSSSPKVRRTVAHRASGYLNYRIDVDTGSRALYRRLGRGMAHITVSGDVPSHGTPVPATPGTPTRPLVLLGLTSALLAVSGSVLWALKQECVTL